MWLYIVIVGMSPSLGSFLVLYRKPMTFKAEEFTVELLAGSLELTGLISLDWQKTVTCVMIVLFTSNVWWVGILTKCPIYMYW